MGLFDKILRKKEIKQDFELNHTSNQVNSINVPTSKSYDTIKKPILCNGIQVKTSIEQWNLIKQNEEKAHKFRYGSKEERNHAIAIYEENISYGVYCDSYSELFLLYYEKREYDKAIDVIKKEIDFFIQEFGESPERLNNRLEMVENQKLIVKFADNNQKGMAFEEQGNYDEAVKLYEENIELNADTPYSYSALARIYHWKKEFESERDILKLAVTKFEDKENTKNSFKDQLENVEYYLKNEVFLRDCLPSDPKSIYYEIKEAKQILNENKDLGCQRLEEIIEMGTYNNTAYYTLYKTYLKDKKYDDAIKICKKAIEILGVFSKDRIEKYLKYMRKIPTYEVDSEFENKYESKLSKLNQSEIKIKSNAKSYSDETPRFCMKCLTKIDQDAIVCHNCQYDFTKNYYTFEDKSFLNNPSFSNLTQKELTIKNIDVSQVSTSKKAKFEYNSKELFVEEVAMEYYKKQGYSAIWSENSYWSMIYALLFWDIIFMPTDTCVQVPMNHNDFKFRYDFLIYSEMIDMPKDFFKPSFYPQRKDAIENRIKELLNNDISLLIRESYYENYGKRCRPIEDWDKYSIDELTIPIKSLKNEQLILIMDRLLHDFAYCRSGLTDVIVFNEEEFIFVEAKSKKDTLSDNQVEWHEYLLNTVKTKVILFTLNKTERQLKNLAKKYENISKKDYTMKLSFNPNSYNIANMKNLSGEELINKQKDNELFAKELESVNMVDDAVKLYEANVKTNVPFKESYNSLANFYAKKQDYEKAITVCKIGLNNVTDVKDQNFLRRRIEVFKNNKSLNKSNYQKNESNSLKSSFDKKPTFERYCIYCGTGLSNDSNFCHNCGAKVEK